VLKFALDMVNKFLLSFKKIKSEKITYKEDFLTKLGREQLKQMIERGIELPVVPLK
jgi:hypothetical protein